MKNASHMQDIYFIIWILAHTGMHIPCLEVWEHYIRASAWKNCRVASLQKKRNQCQSRRTEEGIILVKSWSTLQKYRKS